MTTFSELLRDAIGRDRRSQRSIALAAGLDPAQVSRFMRTLRTLTLPAAEALVVALGLEVRLVKPRKGR